MDTLASTPKPGSRGLHSVNGVDRAEKRPSRAEAEEAVRTLIAWAGDDPSREGLADTPSRVAEAYEKFFPATRATPTIFFRAPSRMCRVMTT